MFDSTTRTPTPSSHRSELGSPVVSSPPAANTDVFCRIVAGDLNAAVVARTQEMIAFLDHRPVFKGHVLVAPVAHVDTLLDLPPSLMAPLLTLTQRIARGIGVALGAEGSFVAMNNVVSQSVPHLHMHVVPRWAGDTNFMTVVGDTKVLPETLAETFARVSARLHAEPPR